MTQARWNESDWRKRVIEGVGNCERSSLSGSIWDFVREAKEQGVGEAALTSALKIALHYQKLTENTMKVRLSEARRVMRFHGNLDSLPQNLQEAAQEIRAREKEVDDAPKDDRRNSAVECVRNALREIRTALTHEHIPSRRTQLESIISSLDVYKSSLIK